MSGERERLDLPRWLIRSLLATLIPLILSGAAWAWKMETRLTVLEAEVHRVSRIAAGRGKQIERLEVAVEKLRDDDEKQRTRLTVIETLNLRIEELIRKVERLR